MGVNRLCRVVPLALLLGAMPPVSASAQTTLRLAWDANTETDLAGYRINYVPQSGGTTRTVDVGNVTTADVTNLELGRWYNFTVSAYNRMGAVSAPSAPVAAFTTAVGLTASASGTVAPGTTTTWTATPAPGSPALQYQFWMLSNGSWQVVRAYSASPTFTWTPAMADVGSHALQVWARQVGSSANWEAYAGTGMFEVAARPFTVTALTASAVSPFLTGQPVQFSAVVEPADLTAALEYQFWLLDKATSTWSIVRPYGSGNTFTFNPGWDQAGAYAMQVWARYPGTTVRYAGWLGTEFRVDRGIGTLSTNVVPPVAPGTQLTWTAEAGTSSTPLQYRFYLFANGAWQIAQDYGTTQTFTWTPGAADLGTHALQVWVKTSTSTERYDAWRGTGYFEVSRTAPSVVAINFSSPPRSGVATTISATASGGYAGPLQYRFWAYSSATGSWTMLRDYGTSSTFTWTPATPGSYNVQVWVRSAGSTANYEGWLGTSSILVP